MIIRMTQTGTGRIPSMQVCATLSRMRPVPANQTMTQPMPMIAPTRLRFASTANSSPRPRWNRRAECLQPTRRTSHRRGHAARRLRSGRLSPTADAPSGRCAGIFPSARHCLRNARRCDRRTGRRHTWTRRSPGKIEKIERCEAQDQCRITAANPGTRAFLGGRVRRVEERWTRTVRIEATYCVRDA